MKSLVCNTALSNYLETRYSSISGIYPSNSVEMSENRKIPVHYWQKFLKKLLKCYFDDIFFGETKLFILSNCTVWKKRNSLSPKFFFVKSTTGWPKSKFLISNDSTAKTMHIWPHIGKVKIGLRGGSFLW